MKAESREGDRHVQVTLQGSHVLAQLSILLLQFCGLLQAKSDHHIIVHLLGYVCQYCSDREAGT